MGIRRKNYVGESANRTLSVVAHRRSLDQAMVQEIAAEIKPLLSWPWFAGHCQSQSGGERRSLGLLAGLEACVSGTGLRKDICQRPPAVPPVPHSRAGFLAGIRGMTATLSSDTQP